MRAKAYGGKKMPKSDVLPLGTKKARGAGRAGQARGTEKKIEKVVDITPIDEVVFVQSAITPSAITPSAITPSAITQSAIMPQQEQNMTLTLKTLSKNGKQAYYSGAAQVLRFPIGVFPDKTAPASFSVADGIFLAPAVKQPKQPKVKLTKEQRAALPKPTLAEMAKRAQDRADKLAAKAAAATAL